MELIDRLINKFGYNEPIFIKEIQSAWSEYSRPRVFQLLKQYTKESLLMKLDLGVYYIPTETVFGKSDLNPQKVAIKKYIEANNEVFGYFTGLTVANSLGLTAQVPNALEIVTTKETTRVRNVKIGNSSFILRRAKTKITKDNAATLQFLELMNYIHAPVEKAQLEAIKTFIKTNKIKLDRIFQYSKLYPKSVIKTFLKSGLNRIFDYPLDTDVYPKEIPKTTPLRYVSGRYALNIPNATSGDWHFTTVWLSDKLEKVDLWGKGQKNDTTPFFGKFGITDKKDNLEQTGLTSNDDKVYIADHYRAILDLLVLGAINKNMNLVTGATMDYLDTNEQKTFLLSKAEKVLSSSLLQADQKAIVLNWINKEKRNVYRGEAYEF